jgi:hypothetical protein
VSLKENTNPSGAVKDTSPIFVVGMNGSGNTMLADSLGKHPALYMFLQESKLLPYYIGKLDSFGDLSMPANRRRLAHAIGNTAPYRLANHRIPLALSDDELANCSTFSDVVTAMFQHLSRKQDKLRWGDKSPMHVQHITTLAQYFPNARFIHIIRDGRDAAQSFHRRWRYDPRLAIWRWKRAVRDGRSQGSRLGPQQYLEVRYEALTQDPETQMQRICDFAGLSFDPAVLGSSMRQMDPGHTNARAGRIVQNSQKWRSYFSSEQLAAMEALSGKALAELGYPVEIAGDADLAPAQVLLLRARDRFAYTRWFFRHRGFTAFPMYVRYLVVSWKQWLISRY